MLQYSNEQFATIIGVPIVTILLIWTVTIFHKNRKKWNSYDIAIVAIIIQSILRNLSILAYTALLIAKNNHLNLDYCRAVVWIFNSIHTFQASSLTTLAVIALFTVKLYQKQQRLQQYLTPTHVIYHLFCLTTLCACVGVAAILAQEDVEDQKYIRFNISAQDYNAEGNSICKFMPFELDVKFNIFIVVLHLFLALVTFVSFVCMCFAHMRIKRHGFDYLKKSSSDLSELSLSLSASCANPSDNNSKSYYDTYTVQRSPQAEADNNYDAHQHHAQNHATYQHGYCSGNREPVWNSDLSNISMTVSSTNSKRPCLGKPLQEEEDVETGLQTMYPILTVCYLFNHLPLIFLCVFPRLVSPWPVSGVALWMGQLQDVLIPIGLGLVDSRFCKWVSKVYKCSERRKTVDKIPPGVGLDGKFRHFGSQPQSLETPQTHYERPRIYSQGEPKFPITNGSLYTSIDGRLPIIHNYRRHTDKKGRPRVMSPHSLNVNLHSSHLKRQEYVRPRQHLQLQQQQLQQQQQDTNSIENSIRPNCVKCENSQRNYPDFPIVVRHSPSFNNPCYEFENQPVKNRLSLSQDSLTRVLDGNHKKIITRPRINRQKIVHRSRLGLDVGLGVNNRISKSEDCLNELQNDLKRFKQNPEIFQNKTEDKRELSVSSDEEYFTDNNANNLNETSVDYDATSQSSYSITTEANCDFDFFQSKDKIDDDYLSGSGEGRLFFSPDQNGFLDENNKTGFKQAFNLSNFAEAILARSKNSELDRNFRITRSNSKRSLENFHAYVDEEDVGFFGGYKIQRSNSFMTIKDRKRINRVFNGALLDDNGNDDVVSNSFFLNDDFNCGDVYLDNRKHIRQKQRIKQKNETFYSGSVPDFKKVFISEYI